MLPTTRACIPILLALTALAAGCGGSDEPSAPSSGPTLSIVAGDAQAGPVGGQLPVPITVSTTRRGGPAAGVVVGFQVETGGGTVSRAQATTDAAGTASVLWTLGGLLGEQRLRITTEGAGTLTATAQASPGPPALVSATEGNGQFAVVRRPLPLPIKVQVTDAFGNPLGATAVTFSVAAGGGIIADSVRTTDAGGFATLASWTLGPTPGFNRLKAAAGPAIGEIIAVGTAAALLVTAGNNQTANAGTLTPVRPAVTAYDADGQPLPGTVVTFEVAGGNGIITAPAQTTGADGTARPGTWVLGLAPGPNQLRATALGVAEPALISATGVAAIPAVVAVTGPSTFEGLLGNLVAARPEVRVTDAAGAPVAGVALAWRAAGGGVAIGPGGGTDFDGRAALTGWRLGGSAPSQTLEAAVGGLGAVTFSATASAPPPSQFAIEVRYPGTQPTEAQKAAFDRAAVQWGQAILGDLLDIPLNVGASGSGCYPALDETVDDLLIFASLETIDGAGGVLGSAGPCLIRTANKLTVVGRMRFDVADLATLEANNQLNSVILHEMGHVLGFGTLWQTQSLLIGAGSADPYFIGPTAQAAFLEAAGPAGFTGSIVPVENTGGAGTRDGHWRETTLRSELMTGYLNSGDNPLSAISISALRDQGYLVNDTTGDPFTLPQFLIQLGAPAVQLREVPAPWPVYTVNRRGVIDGVVSRY